MKDNVVLKRIQVLLIVVIALLALNTILLIVFNGNSGGSNNTTTDENEFTTAKLDDVLKLFDNEGKTVVYLGKDGCSWCEKFIPHLQEAQSAYGYKTVYLDVTTVSKSSNSYSEFLKKLDGKEYTLDPDGEGDQTHTYGEWYDQFGFTPMLFIIEDGKFKDGIIGYYDQTGLNSFLETNGFESK